MKTLTKSQWVIESSNPKTHWSWSSFYTTKDHTEAQMEIILAARKKALPKLQYRLFKQEWKVA